MPLLGDTFKEKVQPDVEDLTTNMEEDDDDKDDALYLGKVEFSLDYDFANRS